MCRMVPEKTSGPKAVIGMDLGFRVSAAKPGSQGVRVQQLFSVYLGPESGYMETPWPLSLLYFPARNPNPQILNLKPYTITTR